MVHRYAPSRTETIRSLWISLKGSPARYHHRDAALGESMYSSDPLMAFTL